MRRWWKMSGSRIKRITQRTRIEDRRWVEGAENTDATSEQRMRKED